MIDLLQHETQVRAGMFGATLLAVALAERLAPVRGDARLARRTAVNLLMVLIDTLVLRLAFPLLAVGAAALAQERGLGLFHALDWPYPLAFALSLLLLDLAIYWQHRLLHAIPLLWRLHRVHHSDLAFDATTGVRFHPLEIALSMAVKLALVALLGPPVLAVLVFEILLSSGALFTHADFALPPRLDRALRVLLVTPSMHRVHHSDLRAETDSNYGFHLSVWDRLFRSYTAAPREPEATMTIGLPGFREAREQSLAALLWQPFRDIPRT